MVKEFTTKELRESLRRGRYTALGSYPVHYLTSDGGTLHPQCVRENLREVIEEIRDETNGGWRVVAEFVNYESELYCDHCSERQESAYAEDQFTVEGRFTTAIASRLEGVQFFSVGASLGCEDCGLGSTVDDCEACEGNGRQEGNMHACKACHGEGTITTTATEDDRDHADSHEFSSSDCDSCGSSVAGDRHPAHGVVAETATEAQLPENEISHYKVCTDCLLFHANGDLPETWDN